MKTYLVGGAVRDKLLGIKNNDKDFVVINSNPKEMLGLGFIQIGKDFPVFLHPKTKNEYALARVERKISAGYNGFGCKTKNITLKQDLSRRDLTINSMAMDENDCLIDYFAGKQHLEQKILKHTSLAFTEDPVRVLRLARFFAKFTNLGFKIDKLTIELSKQMVSQGEVSCLKGERVFAELNKTLTYQQPSYFFKALIECNAYQIIFDIKTNHKASDYINIDNLNTTPKIKFALWFSLYSTDEIKKICKKIKAPVKYKELALLTRFKDTANNFDQLTPQEKLDFYQQTDGLRRVDRFLELLEVFTLMQLKTQKIRIVLNSLMSMKFNNLSKNNIALEIKKARLNKIKYNNV